MMAPTRWGIVGAGEISSDFTLALELLPTENHQVVAVGARDKSRAEAFAKEHNIPKAYGSYEEIANGPDIDIAYVGTIHTTHHYVCKILIGAGKNVLCEKPLTMSLKQAEELVTLAREKNVFFMEGYWSRFFPIYGKLREEIEANTIGEIRMLQAEIGFATLHQKRMVENEQGGGALLSYGCYAIQLALLLFKELPVKTVACCALLKDKGVDVVDCVTLYFSDDRIAQFNCHMGVTLDQTARIYGTKGMMTMPFFLKPETLTTPEKKYNFPWPTHPKAMNYPRSEGFVYEAEAVRQSLLKGEKENPLMPHKDSLDTMTILDEIRRQVGLVFEADM